MTNSTIHIAIPHRSRSSRCPRKWEWSGLAFCTPYVVVFLFGTIIPMLYALYLGFFREQMLGGVSFTGFANYMRALTDSLLWDGLCRVLLYFVIQTPLMLILALIAALMLDSRRLTHIAVPRVLLFVPYAVPGVIAAMMWGYIYGDDYGLIGQLFKGFGATPPNVLGQQVVLFAIANIQTWCWVGYNMLIFYSALRVIPEELYESARIDGASEIRIAWSVKIPQIKSALVMALLFSIIGSFQLFNEPNTLRQLAPESISSHYTPNMYAYNLAFTGQNTNYAAAVSLVVGIITIALVAIVKWVGSRNED